MDSIVTCSRDARNELITIECEALTGGRPDVRGIARGRVDRVHQGAFVKLGVQLLAQAPGLEQLVSRVADLALQQDEFRIEWLATGGYEGSRWDATIAIADQIDGNPNLVDPGHRYLLLAGAGEMSFGRVAAQASRDYRKHDGKPCHTPSSLPAQLARCLVNLVAHHAQTIADPCCGTGSILLEAASLGLSAQGGDLNPRMVAMSRQNVDAFGYQTRIDCVDARTWKATADAVVTDLPYGRGLEVAERSLREIISQALEMAPMAIFVAGEDVSQWLSGSGYSHVETYRLLKSRGFSRYIHRAWREHQPRGVEESMTPLPRHIR
jgi:predicted RNA methylase